MVECTGLENRHGFIAHPGFKSLLLRQKNEKGLAAKQGLFCVCFLSTGKYCEGRGVKGEVDEMSQTKHTHPKSLMFLAGSSRCKTPLKLCL